MATISKCNAFQHSHYIYFVEVWPQTQNEYYIQNPKAKLKWINKMKKNRKKDDGEAISYGRNPFIFWPTVFECITFFNRRRKSFRFMCVASIKCMQQKASDEATKANE